MDSYFFTLQSYVLAPNIGDAFFLDIIAWCYLAFSIFSAPFIMFKLRR